MSFFNYVDAKEIEALSEENALLTEEVHASNEYINGLLLELRNLQEMKNTYNLMESDLGKVRTAIGEREFNKIVEGK